MEKITQRLFELKDDGYKSFSASLMPTVNHDAVIGVRVPQIRKFASELAKTDDAKLFLKQLPHRYFEENNLHAFVAEKIKDFDEAVREAERLLPYIDNWATCDMYRPKVFAKNKNRLLPYIEKWLNSEHTYTVRYGIGMLMSHFLDEDFNPSYLKRVSKIKSDEYYINMMIAWYFATALAKQYDAVLYLKNKSLGTWVHNKTIQKAIESNRISKETKAYLKTLKKK